MGSVAVLTTSGDNDPELEPVQSYRHYLYCDACGSFDLVPWEAGDRAQMERRRLLARQRGVVGVAIAPRAGVGGDGDRPPPVAARLLRDRDGLHPHSVRLAVGDELADREPLAVHRPGDPVVRRVPRRGVALRAPAMLGDGGHGCGRHRRGPGVAGGSPRPDRVPGAALPRVRRDLRPPDCVLQRPRREPTRPDRERRAPPTRSQPVPRGQDRRAGAGRAPEPAAMTRPRERHSKRQRP